MNRTIGAIGVGVRCGPAGVFALILCLTGCTGDAAREQHAQAVALTGGDPQRGIEAIGRYGCASCHDIPGIRPSGAAVGPPLAGIAARAYLAGRLPNSPANMMIWIQHPQHVARGTAMPEMGVTERDARDITALLYTLH